MKMRKTIAATLFLLSLLFSQKGFAENPEWWNDAVFYQIWPRSFQDSNGDGNGDFQGIISRLDYLQELGVNAIWLTPMFEAPSYHGYDFQKLYDVEQDYGSMADFEQLLAETEKRGVKVIADLVLNHISTENDWFIKSTQKIEPYTNYFVWSKEIPEGAWGKPWASPEHPEWGYNKPESVWFYNDARGEYYYAAFDKSQPDLNLKNTDVVAELKNVAKFWIDKGFDGFRLDAIRYLIEDGPYPLQADTPATIDFWIDFNQYVKSLQPDIMLVGEVWAPKEIISKYYNDGDGVDLCFDFNFGNEVMNALNATVSADGAFGDSGGVSGQKSLAGAIARNFREKTQGAAPVSFYSPFLTNHDQNRVMYGLGNDVTKMKMAAVLLLTGVGAPYIYYGEEIGLSQNKDGDIRKRALMQWDDSRYAGFTTANAIWLDEARWFPWKQNYKPWWNAMWNAFEDKNAHSVAGQKHDSASLLNLYKKLIRIRRNNHEFRAVNDSSIEFINTRVNALAYQRIASDGTASLVIVNGSSTKSVKFQLEQLRAGSFLNLLNDSNISFADGKVNLSPGGFLILKLK